PDRFAALAEFKGPTDLAAWYYESPSRQANIAKDCDNHSPNVDPFAYQRKSVSSMPMNLGNMPTIIVHGTQDTVVPYHHATDFKSGLDYYADLYYGGQRRATLYPYEGGHDADHPDWSAAAVLGFFAQHTVNLNPRVVTVRTDEPKSYYWLDIAYAVATGDHWTQVNAWLEPDGSESENRSVTIDVYDERNKPINLTLDLARMGLPVGVSYTVEDANITTGGYQQYAVQADGSRLVLNIPGDRHRLVVYPHAGPQPQMLVLSHGQNGYNGVVDTFIEVYSPQANHAADALRLTNGGSRAALIRFDLQDTALLPPGAVVKSAQLRLYAVQKWDPSHSIETSLYGLLKPWDVQQVTWQSRFEGAGWAAPGAGAVGEDFEGVRYGPLTMNAVPQWYTFNVTDLVQRWVANPASNYGLIVRAEGGLGTFTLNSSESPSNKPELVIVWAQATPTPSITQTPRPTHTPTPTLTPWASTTPHNPDRRFFIPTILKGRSYPRSAAP
ncbi:MAG: DNRLRE domain-containing protein, partial [Chloroflexi bacterium]|nr:DNRLRE domain-containing protein [Chloroflexota bacterium]